MPNKTKRYCQRRRGKHTTKSEHASLSSVAPLIESKQILSPIHQEVIIDQKTVDYRPTDQLVFVALGILNGCECIDDVNHNPPNLCI